MITTEKTKLSMNQVHIPEQDEGINEECVMNEHGQDKVENVDENELRMKMKNNLKVRKMMKMRKIMRVMVMYKMGRKPMKK